MKEIRGRNKRKKERKKEGKKKTSSSYIKSG